MPRYVSFGNTESGDELTPVDWGKEMPTTEEVDAYYRQRYPEEFGEVGFVHWTIRPLETPQEFLDRKNGKE